MKTLRLNPAVAGVLLLALISGLRAQEAGIGDAATAASHGDAAGYAHARCH